ncbi:hypothetical protein TEQG_01694 [Trichophyton equinum CBS 127.97]|uniref:Uncharacterized protein n=1 Tax=Trichophyton equinum (strain ATCC MYA-4606 / CBS 127.97) TaxID=559882 RepID=F2PL61_TRIEC|nr:hypothetical protein TEQG_01694 [Trichophyton equinum CBS 127.97]
MACCQCMSTLYRAFASVWSEDVEGEQKPSNLPSTGHSTNPGRLRAHFPIIQLSMLPFENRGHGLSCLFKAENRHPQMDEPKHISSFLYLKYLGISWDKENQKNQPNSGKVQGNSSGPEIIDDT